MATITVIGATGGIGRHVVEFALAEGHTVRALARTPSKLSSHANLQVVQGSVTGLERVTEAIQGSEIVLSCLGTSRGDSPVVTNGTQTLVTAMQMAGMTRLAMISSVGVGDSERQGKRVSRVFMYMIVPMILGERFYELAAAEDVARQLPNAVVVRPTGLTNKEGTGRYRATDHHDRNVSMRIARADVGRFMVDLITNREHDGQSVSLFSA